MSCGCFWVVRIVVIEAVVVGPASADAVSAALVGGVVVVLVVAVEPHVNAKSRPADSMGLRCFRSEKRASMAQS